MKVLDSKSFGQTLSNFVLFFSFLFLLFFFGSGVIQAQPSLARMRNEASVQENGPVFSIRVMTRNPNMGLISFSANRPLRETAALAWLQGTLQMRQDIDEWRQSGLSLVTKDSLVISRYHQYYKGIRVSFGSLTVLCSKGLVRMMTLEFFPVNEQMPTTPALVESAGLQKACTHLGAVRFSWDNYQGNDSRMLKPVGKLVIVRSDADSSLMELCYSYKIYSLEPHAFTEVFVSARDGHIVSVDRLDDDDCQYAQSSSLSTPVVRKYSNPHPSTNEADASTPLKLGAINSLANVLADGNTRNSGFRADIVTDNASGIPDKPFRLMAGVGPTLVNPVVTLDYQERRTDEATSDGLAADFVDNDNHWVEYADPGFYDRNNTLSAFEVHFNMQLVSEYWFQRHQRIGFDNLAGPILSYTNAQVIRSSNEGVREMNGNAAWNKLKKCVYFSRSTVSQSNPLGVYPLVSLDVCAHEIGHAVCQSLIPNPNSNESGGLRSIGESGALNEGFSDIWAACVEKYANEKFPPPLMTPKNYWVMSEENSINRLPNRSLLNPKSLADPDTYRSSIHWKDPTVLTEDRGGVHTNCTILGKWFNLITEGGTGTNDLGVSYEITPQQAFGFEKAETYVYFAEALLPYDADYEMAAEVFINSIESLNASDPTMFTESDIRVVKSAWRAVGVHVSELFDMVNTPVFTTNEFQAIAVGKDGVVWAGTNQKGLYRYNIDLPWTKCTQAISSYNINDMDVDALGVLWIAQSGREFQNDEQPLNGGGGAHRFPNPDCAVSSFYTTPQPSNPDGPGMVSRNSRELYINSTTPPVIGDGPQVWITGFAHYESDGSFRKGGVSLGTQTGSGYSFQRFNAQITADNGGADAIGGNATEVWAFAKNNSTSPPRGQILRYSNVGAYLGAYDNTTVPELPVNLDVSSIYFDKSDNKWVGTYDGKIYLMDFTSTWGLLNFTGIEEVFPPGTIIGKGITGDNQFVYFPTSSGLVIYTNRGIGVAISRSDFKLVTTRDGLPSNKISSIAVDSKRGGLWLATDKGIYFFPTPNYPRKIVFLQSVSDEYCSKKINVSVSTSGEFGNEPFANKFYFEMSDEFGSFDNPITLREPIEGTTLTGNFQFDYPESGINSPNEFNYWIRIRSDNPPLIGIGSTPLPNPIKFAYTKDKYNEAPVGGKFIESSRSCVGPDGWTHFYYNEAGTSSNRDILLLSVRTNGADFSNVVARIGISNNPGILQSQGREVTSNLLNTRFWAMNRYWQLYKSDGTTMNTAEPFEIRFYYFAADLADVNGIISNGPVNHQQLQFYTVSGGAQANPDPVSNFANCTDVKTLVNREGLVLPMFTFNHLPLGGNLYAAEFHDNKIPTGGGAGMTASGGPLNNGNIFTVRQGNWDDPATWSNGKIPDNTSELTLFHTVNVNVINAECKSITASEGGNITIASGVNLQITGNR